MDSTNYLLRLTGSVFRPRGKPLLIWIAGPWLMIAGAGGTLFLLVAMVYPGGYEVAGVNVSDNRFKGMISVTLMGNTCFQAVIGYGLFNERRWARSLATKWTAVVNTAAVVLMVILVRVSAVSVISDSWLNIIVLVGSFWYFYRYEPVVAYYDRMR